MKNSTPSKMPSMLHPPCASPRIVAASSKSVPKNPLIAMDPRTSTAAINEQVLNPSSKKQEINQQNTQTHDSMPVVPAQSKTQEPVQAKADIPEIKKNETQECISTNALVSKENSTKPEKIESASPAIQEAVQKEPSTTGKVADPIATTNHMECVAAKDVECTHSITIENPENQSQIMCDQKNPEEMQGKIVEDNEKKCSEKCEPMKEIAPPNIDTGSQENAHSAMNEPVKPQQIAKVPLNSNKRKAYMVCSENQGKRVKVEKENQLHKAKVANIHADYSNVKPKVNTNLKNKKN